MNKAEVVRLVAARLGMPQQQVRLDLDAWLDALMAAVARGERVELRGFGVFAMREARGKGRAPAKAPGRYLPRFKAARGVIGAMNGHRARVGGPRQRGRLR